MSRPTPEWIGKHHGVNIPPRVRLRVYDAHKGICYLCRLPIKPTETWQADHVTALINGGEHRERNLAPAHGHCHVAKSAKDVAGKAKVAAIRKKHLGITVEGPKIRSAPFQKTRKAARREQYAATKLPLPPRKRPLIQPKEATNDAS